MFEVVLKFCKTFIGVVYAVRYNTSILYEYSFEIKFWMQILYLNLLIASDAVDALIASKWAKGHGQGDILLTTRASCVNQMNM